MRFFADMVYIVAALLASPVLIYRMITQGKYRHGLKERLGFVPRTDFRDFHQHVNYRLWPEGKRLISWGPSFSYGYVQDHEGTRLDWRINPSLEWNFRRQTHFGVFWADGAERLRPQDFPGLTENMDFDRGEIGFFSGTRFIDAFNMDLSRRRARSASGPASSASTTDRGVSGSG